MPRLDTSQLLLDAQSATANARGYVRVNCPFCLPRTGKTDRKRSCSFNRDNGWFRCFKCAVHSRAEGFEDEGEDRRIRCVGVTLAPAMLPPEDYTPLCSPDLQGSLSAEPARRYLRDVRGIPEETWTQAALGICLSGKYSGRVVAPVLDPVGTWLGWVTRPWVKRLGSYRNAPGEWAGSTLYNAQALEQDEQLPVLVVEGVFDALAPALWPNAVALLGKPTPAKISLLAGSQGPLKRSLAVVLDGDAWREGQALALALKLRGVRAGFVRLPPKQDPDEVPGDWLRMEVQRCLGVTTWV